MRLLSALLFATMFLVLPRPALAQEVWTLYEVRVPLTEERSFVPNYFRILNDYRYGPGYPWIGQALLRIGPMWDVHPNLALAANFTSNVEQADPGVWEQEFRGEVEPHLRWKLGDVSFNNRHRLEMRRYPTDTRWRYRAQLRLTMQRPDAVWAPYVSDEVFLDATAGVWNQNRLTAGLSYLYGPNARTDIGYLLRSKLSGSTWESEHVLTVSLVFNPKVAPILTDPAGD